MSTRKQETAPDFLAAAKAKSKVVTFEVEALGITVEARGLTADAYSEIQERAMPDMRGRAGARLDEVEIDTRLLTYLTIAATCFKEDGERLIPEGREMELGEIPRDIFGKLQEKTLDVNGLRVEAEAEGNS